MKQALSRSVALSVALPLVLACWLAVGCNGSTVQSETGTYLRSDSPELETSWPGTLPLYQASHQDEGAVVEQLALDPTTRAFVGEDTNRVSFTTPTGVVQVLYDEGFDKPFHALNYLRSEPFQPQTWASSADLRRKWESGARLAADYLGKLSQLTPVVSVGQASDADYAAALTDGYQFMLAVDRRLLWVDDLRVRVDAKGIYEFATDELTLSAAPTGAVDCLTQAEVQAIIAQGGYQTPDPSAPPPIFYGFDVVAETLSPFYLAGGTGETGPLAIPLDRSTAN